MAYVAARSFLHSVPNYRRYQPLSPSNPQRQEAKIYIRSRVRSNRAQQCSGQNRSLTGGHTSASIVASVDGLSSKDAGMLKAWHASQSAARTPGTFHDWAEAGSRPFLARTRRSNPQVVVQVNNKLPITPSSLRELCQTAVLHSQMSSFVTCSAQNLLE